MPELPEVETVRKTLLPLLTGRKIVKIEIFYPRLIQGDEGFFLSHIEGKRIKTIERKGKYLIFRLSDNLSLISHLRMEGRYRVERGDNELKKHDLIVFHLDNNESLIYNDTRKFGVMYLKNDDELYSSEPLIKLGKEPFYLDAREFLKGLSKRKGPIKEALLDQTLIAGIGNIYADEILIRSKINPLQKASQITLKEAKTMLDNAVKILRKAIEEGGSTVRSYHPTDGIDGRMQLLLWAYGREGKPCPICGALLKKIKVGGRGTTYCPHCQRLPNKPFILGVSGPIASGKSKVSNYIASLGYLLLDADRCVHDLYNKKTVQKTLIHHFGEDIFKNEEIDRHLLLSIVSKDEAKKKELEDIVHPLVYQEFEKEIKKHHDGQLVLDVPLLFGTPFEKLCDAIIYVSASREIRIKRLQKRGIDAKASLSLNDSFPYDEAKKRASLVIETDDRPFERVKRIIDECAFIKIKD